MVPNCITRKHITENIQLSTATDKYSARLAKLLHALHRVSLTASAARTVLYIIETCRQFNNRSGEHLQNVKHKDHQKENKIEHSDT